MTHLQPANILMCYDSTLEGFFTLVFRAYVLHVRPAAIAEISAAQAALGQELIEVTCDASCAERVRVALVRCGGLRLYEKIKTAFLSDEQGREKALFAYIERALQECYRIHTDLANPAVARLEKLSRSVVNERERVYQFARFEELDNGALCACIGPKAKIIPLVMDHFIERLGGQPFLIYDDVHHMAGVYQAGHSYLVHAESLQLPPVSQSELRYQQLWKTFYDAVFLEQRYNPSLRRSFMPQRFWRNLTEIKLAAYK